MTQAVLEGELIFGASAFIPGRDLPLDSDLVERCEHCRKPVSYEPFGTGNPVCINPECPYHLG